MKTLVCRDKTLTLGTKTIIMGILNVTPDSFSDGGKFNNRSKAIEHAIQMEKEGADIIDIGGESTRPGADKVNEQEEIDRVIPVLKALTEQVTVPISVDTYKANVAKKALEAGAHIINDVWGLQKQPEIAKYIAEYDVPVVIMHNKEDNNYEKDIVEEMFDFFEKSLAIAFNAGIKKEKIILDPGIGFGKDPEQNIEVMSRLKEFKALGYPLLLGTSRKSMIGYILDLPSDERLEGTLATNIIGAIEGYDFVRVHDVKEHYRALKVTDKIIRG